ncbi:efflux RND transporter periplasmic adaptor subunit [Devosia epidermidihirudinis]|uniref:efflux RND transporter periplasmic adaptor subunit n=1 Tax=Devosia epidermidihirudinis TaxID=1293439 RepID=UPI000AA204B3|nr:efflux RND transporter periplasmic adaptor subunit [Devosia epidermidihirudinis]
MSARSRYTLAAIALLSLTTLAQAQMGRGGAPTGPTAVGYIEPTPENIPLVQHLSGRISASSTANVSSQLSGTVASIEFEEGALIEPGAVLLTLVDGTQQAAVAIARANLSKAEASLVTAQQAVTRNDALAGSITQVARDTARTALLLAQADMEVQQANLRSAEIALNQTRILAPVGGVIGTTSVNVGDVISPQTAIATIRQLDPVYVTLVDTSRNLLSLRRANALENGSNGGASQRPEVTVLLEDGSTYERTGYVDLADVVVSESTGTFNLRAVIPNPDRLLMPGMFVRADVKLAGEQSVYLVPQRAVMRDSRGLATAFFVTDDDKADLRVIETNRSLDHNWVVTAGINPGDRLIVDGIQKISDNSPIAPVPVEIGPNGVIAQTLLPPGSTPERVGRPGGAGGGDRGAGAGREGAGPAAGTEGGAAAARPAAGGNRP